MGGCRAETLCGAGAEGVGGWAARLRGVRRGDRRGGGGGGGGAAALAGGLLEVKMVVVGVRVRETKAEVGVEVEEVVRCRG